MDEAAHQVRNTAKIAQAATNLKPSTIRNG
jgi:hypothetical protein